MTKGVRFERLYRGSVYAMIFMAVLALSIDATTDLPIAMLYPLMTIFICARAYFRVDTGQSPGISRTVGTLLALFSIPLVVAEVRLGWRLLESDLLVLALGHWLTYLVWIKISMPKSVEDDWFIFLLGMVIVLTAGVLSQSDYVGECIFVWSIISLWSLTMFYLEREAARARHPGKKANLSAELRIRPDDQPYLKLFDRPFVFSGIRVVCTALLMSALVFLLIPRAERMSTSRRSGAISRHLTGFDEEVRLGQLGEILENDTIFMTVEFFDEEGKTTFPAAEPYWRGVTMGEYDNGQWKRQTYAAGRFPQNPSLAGAIRQKIRQEPTDSEIIFGLRPVLRARSLMRFRSPIFFNSADGTMFRRTYNNAFEYEVFSDPDTNKPQIGEDEPRDQIRSMLTRVPAKLKNELVELTAPIIKDISPNDTVAQARALEAHFLDPQIYAYTLEQSRVDPNIDPVLDFLKNRKEGHCEYYASSLALMLRTAGIPARLVNGFKGGDWNSLGQVMYVREKYAHAWVEAWVSNGPDDAGRWITLDPTPSNERQANIQYVGLLGAIQQVTDFIRYVWVFYIIGFDAERQYRVLYEPIIALYQEARNGFLIIIQAFRDLWTGARGLSSLYRIFSVSGFVGGLAIAISAIVILQIVRFLLRRFMSRFYAKRRGDMGESQVEIYRRLERLLAELTLSRSTNETPLEFSQRVGLVLRERFMEAGLVGIPEMVVTLFYQIRFGEMPADPAKLASLHESLDRLEHQIRQPV